MMKPETLIIGGVGLYYLLKRGGPSAEMFDVGTEPMDAPTATPPGAPPQSTPGVPIPPTAPGGGGVWKPSDPAKGGGLPAPGDNPTSGAMTPSFGLQGLFDQPGSGVAVTPDGRVFYDYLRRKGWRVSMGAINGVPYIVRVVWPATKGTTITIKNHGKLVVTVGKTSGVWGRSPFKELVSARPEPSSRHPIAPNSINEQIVWYEDMSSTKLRYVYGGDSMRGGIWHMRDGLHYIMDTPVPLEEWDAYHRGSIYGLTKFSADTHPLDYVAYYNANPWVLDAVRMNPCGPAGKALAVLLTEGWLGIQTEVIGHGDANKQPKAEFVAMKNWWLSHLTAQDLASLPQPVELYKPQAGGCGSGGTAPARGSGRPAYKCPRTGQLV